MKITKVLAVLTAVLLITSCSKEDLTPKPNHQKVDCEETIQAPQGKVRAPLAVATPSPCGYGFNVAVTFMGSPISESYPYEIRVAGTTTVVDSGTISHGNNTNWVLSPCTSYDFEFWGSWACPTCSGKPP